MTAFSKGVEYFKAQLDESDIVIKNNNNNADDTIYCDDSNKSLRLLEKSLRLSSTRIEDFIYGLEAYIESNLVSVLAPMQKKDRHDDNRISGNFYNFGQPDTLLRVLLRIQSIQSKVMKYLVSRITACVMHNTNDNDDSTQIALQILNHLRYCDVIYEPKELMVIFLEEAVPQLAATPSLQVEIISGIPALCPDNEKDRAITLLLEIMDSYPDLIPSVLETISNLCLQPSSKSLKLVFEKICEILASAEANLIPVSVRALLELPEDPKIVLPEIRTKLTEFLIDCKNNDDNANQNACTLIVNILKTVFTTKPSLANEFFDFLSKDESPKSLTIADMWIFFGLCTSVKSRPKVQTVLFKKISNGSMSKEVIKESIRKHGIHLDPIFPYMLSLAQSLMSSNRIFGSLRTEKILILCFYKELYFEFDNAIRRQEIVASLVSHVGSPNPKEVDYALAVLSIISAKETKLINFGRTTLLRTGFNPHSNDVTLRNFVPFLKSIFDDVRSMTEPQVRVFFSVLFECSTVASSAQRSAQGSARPSNTNEMVVDDILIYLNKYAHSPDFKIRKIAIIGYVAYLSQASMIHDKASILSQDDDVDERSSDVEVQNLIKIFNSMTRISDDTCGEMFLLDEVSDAILNRKIKNAKFIETLSYKAFEYLDSSLGMDVESAKKSKAAIIANYNILNEPQYGVDVDPTLALVRPEVGGSFLDVIVKVPESTRAESTRAESTSPDTRAESISAEFVFVKVLSGVLAMLRNGDAKSHTIPLSLSTPTSSSSSSSPSFCIDIRCICSYLRLVSTCQHYLNKHYLIGLLVGASLELPTPDCISEMADLPSNAQIAICWSLKYAVDWIREILNTFCVKSNADANESIEIPVIDGRIIYSANQLVVLTDILIQQAQMTPGFMELLDLSLSLSKGKDSTSTNKSKSKKSSKAKEETNKDNGPNIDLVTKVIMSSLRPLDPCVASILGYGLVPKAVNNQTPSKTDTLMELEQLDNSLQSNINVKLTPKAMNMLLQFATTSILQLVSDKGKTDSIVDVDDGENEEYDATTSALYTVLDQWQVKGLFCTVHFLIQKFTYALNGRSNDSESTFGTNNDEVIDASSSMLPQYIHTCTIFDALITNKELVKEVIEFANKESSNDSQSQLTLQSLPLLIKILYDVCQLKIEDTVTDDEIDQLSNICEYGYKVMFDNLLEIVSHLKEPSLFETAMMTINSMEKILIQMKYLESILKWDKMIACFDVCSVKLAEVCDRLLQLTWTNDAIGKRKFSSKDVGVLARIMVQYAKDPISKIASVNTLLEDIAFDNDDDHAQGYPTLKSSTYIYFYSPLYQVLTRMLAEIVESYNGNKEKTWEEHDFENVIRRLSKIVIALHSLMNLTQGESVKNSILLTALREGGKFVSTFMKGEKLIQRLYEEYTEMTLKMISILQKSTRQMQILCLHGKLNKNASLSKEVPTIKRSLEKMIYMMKKLSEMNHASDGFTVGSLKQRNLDGTEWIPSADLNDDDYEENDDNNDDKENDNKVKKRKRQSKGQKSAKATRKSDNHDDDDDDDNDNQENDQEEEEADNENDAQLGDEDEDDEDQDKNDDDDDDDYANFKKHRTALSCDSDDYDDDDS